MTCGDVERMVPGSTSSDYLKAYYSSPGTEYDNLPMCLEGDTVYLTFLNYENTNIDADVEEVHL